MINIIKSRIPKCEIVELDSANLYAVDTKHLNNGKVEIFEIEPAISFVHIANNNNVPVFFGGFEENALEINAGDYSRQCECVIFPQSLNESDWVLFIEMKYVNSIENAFRESNDYPNCMVEQIIQTVDFFRKNGIIAPDRRVNALVSFPTLIEDFSASFFTGNLSVEDILLTYRIKLRPSNFAQIISEKRIRI